MKKLKALLTKLFVAKVYPDWILCTKEVPAESGYYICAMPGNYVSSVMYSTVHGCWNALDWQDHSDNKLEVIAWMPYPPMYESEVQK